MEPLPFLLISLIVIAIVLIYENALEKFRSQSAANRVRMIEAAADLLSEHAENPEYDRGVTELLSDILEIPMDDKYRLQAELRVVKQNINRRGRLA